MKITERCAITADSVISSNDGTNRLRFVSVLVMVESDPQNADGLVVPLAADSFRRWVGDYIDGRDLRLAFDFTPDARALAYYLAVTFSGMDSAVAKVSVSFSGESVYTIDVRSGQ